MSKDSKEREQLTHATAELRKYFKQNPNFYVVGGVAARSGGMVIVEVQQALPSGGFRELMIKRVMKDKSKSLTEERTRSLEREIQILTALQGAGHIVQRVVLDPDPLQVPLPGEQTGISGPYLVMEKMRLGTLDAFIKKCTEAPYPIPNRVLWGIFVSLIQACVAMAWPPKRPNNSPTTDETPGAGPPGNLIHLDINTNNVLCDFPASALDIIPRVKLADFGRCRINGGKDVVFQEDIGYHENVYAIGKVMLALIFRNPRIQIVQTTTLEFPRADGTAVQIPVDWGRSGHPLGPIPGLDRDLQQMVALCLAQRPSHRPALPALLTQAQQGAARTRDYYAQIHSPYYELENTELITAVMNYIFLNGKPPVTDLEAAIDW
ncbi:hypothetical protein F4810DRAFT_720804 [Camillea tinctor]|nr:hypothetical protein F4810DRAFT_720804 [Camillea tinctor]